MKPSKLIFSVAMLGAVGIGGYLLYKNKDAIANWLSQLTESTKTPAPTPTPTPTPTTKTCTTPLPNSTITCRCSDGSIAPCDKSDSGPVVTPGTPTSELCDTVPAAFRALCKAGMWIIGDKTVQQLATETRKRHEDVANNVTIPRGKVQLPGVITSTKLVNIDGIVDIGGQKVTVPEANVRIDWNINGAHTQTNYDMTIWEFCNYEGTPCRERLGINVPCPAFDLGCVWNRAKTVEVGGYSIPQSGGSYVFGRPKVRSGVGYAIPPELLGRATQERSNQQLMVDAKLESTPASGQWTWLLPDHRTRVVLPEGMTPMEYAQTAENPFIATKWGLIQQPCPVGDTSCQTGRYLYRRL